MKYLKPFQWVVRFIIALIQPAFWRGVFTGRVKVAVYLDTGEKFYVKCTHWKIVLGESYNFTGLDEEMAFRPGRIIGLREVSWWR